MLVGGYWEVMVGLCKGVVIVGWWEDGVGVKQW